MVTGNSVAAFYVTDKGSLLAHGIKGLYPDLTIMKFTKGAVRKAWSEEKVLIFIMAAGIVVRTVSPLLKDKKSDPAVIVLDEKGRYAISLVSGHLGGANEKAEEIAHFLGGKAIITTASDVNGVPAIDLFARAHALSIDDWKLLPRIGTRFINKGRLNVYADIEMRLPAGFVKVSDPASADILITNRRSLGPRRGLYLRPRNIVVGIGCNRGTSAEEIGNAVRKAFDEHNLSFSSIRALATIDRKADEGGVKMFARKSSLSILSFCPEELNGVAGISESEAAFRATGAKAVAEPAALLGARAERLLVEKQKIGNVTVAAAEIRGHAVRGARREEQDNLTPTGRIYVVGTGPGNIEHITPYAQKAIRESDVIVGYSTYVKLIRKMIIGKEVFETGMTQEIDRCRKAVELALGGKSVAVISGGDPGIYAMAGLVFQLLKEEGREPRLPPVEVIPGISALNACAAKLGAPLMHDFASISLSDRLTPWKVIEKRIDAAATADFVIVLYNPKSKGRAGHINKVRKIILRHRLPNTPVGIVKGAMREDEKIIITDLNKMLDYDIDMRTTVIVGNSRTFLWNDRMITPRGYEKKFKT
jgi:cobalt-precorrin 5A hydrolase / precorrin-3B C17-methyltransferase